MNLLKRSACPVCTSTTFQPVAHPGSGDTWQLARCEACGFLFLQNPPETDTAAEQFPWEKTYKSEKQRRNREHGAATRAGRRWIARAKRKFRALTRRDKVAALSQSFFKPGPVLDIGCGNGSLARSLPAHSEPWGIELSPALAQEARERFQKHGNGDVVLADALSGLQSRSDDSFQGILARSYLEHEIRPYEVLCEMRRVLAEDGALILKVPNFGSVNRKIRGDLWCGYRFPDHVNYFRPTDLEHLLRRAGLKVVRFGLQDRFPTSDNMWCVATPA